MLPTSGYFRDILCPFLKSGLCERTHCHYRHDKRYELKASTSKSSSKCTSKSIPDYVPTPVSRLKPTHSHASADRTDRTGINSDNKSKSKFENIYKNIPEYKPTPISELRKQQIGTYSHNESDPTDQTNGKKDKSSKSSDESTNGKQTKSSNKTLKTEVKAKNATKAQTKTKNELKVDKSSLKSVDKTETKTKSKTKTKTQKNCEKSYDFDSDSNEDLFESLNRISSSNRKHSFDEMITTSDESYESATKKVRIAHQSNTSVSPKKLEKKSLRPTPSQQLQKRYAIQNIKVESNDDNSTQTKAQMTPKPNYSNESEAKPSADSVGNSVVGKKRIAHKGSALKRPIITSGGKVSLKTRQNCLNKFIDECLVFCTEEEAFKRGLESEKAIYERSKSENIYKVLSVHEVTRIRTQCANTKNSSSVKNMSAQEMKKFGNPVVSHEAILNGKISGTFSVEKRQKSLSVEDLSDIELYKMLLKYVMSEAQLKEYGYPRPHPTKRNSAQLPKLEPIKRRNDYESQVRTCGRCQKTYTIDEYEMPIRKETCIYHSGRLWNERFNKSIERKYSCCKNDVGAGGCSSNPYHIIDGFDRPDYCDNYVRTLPLKPAPQSGYYGVYGLDCEMCYTTHGLELTRVTVVNANHQTIYESLVKPSNAILDYNSKFSGIKESDLQRVTTTLKDVQTRLQSLFNDKTILIGHSLESDLKSLKLIHNTVVDTAQVFPHKRGLPYKRALRTLTAEFLKKIIQNDEEGHDSREDATAALKLMLWKIGEDLKRYKR